MKAKLLLGILFCSTAAWSQGIYSPEESKSEKTVTTISTYGGSLRGIPGSGGAEQPPATGDPVGGGILILSLLAGGYTIARSRKGNKKV